MNKTPLSWMRIEIRIPLIIFLLTGLACFAAAQDSKPPVAPHFSDEPQAHALYDAMIAALRQAPSLTFESDFQFGSQENMDTTRTYRALLKKPNYFRIDLLKRGRMTSGTLIGDGQTMWTFWGGPRPHFSSETDEEYRKSSTNVYMKKPAPPARHSIWHETSMLGMGLTVFDLSTFHGYTDSLQPYVDAVRSMGAQAIDGELCDGIEVSIMKGQRTWELWLARRDRLPRRLRMVVRVSNEIIGTEHWKNVVVGGEIPAQTFKWTPPAGWRQWRLPDPEERLLKPGVDAPDFDCQSIDGKRIRLSDYRGKVVWLVFWRVGCPPCREEMPELQKAYARFKDKGLVVLGFNAADDKAIATEFLDKYGVTFPTILDASPNAINVTWNLYHAAGVPQNYLITRDGKIGAIQLGYGSEDKNKILDMLKTQGIQ